MPGKIAAVGLACILDDSRCGNAIGVQLCLENGGKWR
jgi:hypothetical protein